MLSTWWKFAQWWISGGCGLQSGAPISPSLQQAGSWGVFACASLCRKCLLFLPIRWALAALQAGLARAPLQASGEEIRTCGVRQGSGGQPQKQTLASLMEQKTFISKV